MNQYRSERDAVLNEVIALIHKHLGESDCRFCDGTFMQEIEELRQIGNSKFNVGDSVQFADELQGIKFGIITKIRNDNYQISVHVRDELYRKWSIRKDDLTAQRVLDEVSVQKEGKDF